MLFTRGRHGSAGQKMDRLRRWLFPIDQPSVFAADRESPQTVRPRSTYPSTPDRRYRQPAASNRRASDEGPAVVDNHKFCFHAAESFGKANRGEG